PERIEWSYRAQSLLSAGLVLPGSSDRPVAHGAPLSVMQSFVERVTETGVLYGGDERLTAEQALHAYTAGSAAATGSADFKGSLSPGKAADLTVLSEDPTTADSSTIGKIDVLATVLGGRVSWGADLLPGVATVGQP
ncbi:MAG: amidohydrolase family protein, partial [Rhodococcus sp. (in: high G+C Gram-positive bacteria)]